MQGLWAAGKAAPDFNNMPAGNRVNVIIQFNQSIDTPPLNSINQLFTAQGNTTDGKPKKQLNRIRSAVFTLPVQLVMFLQNSLDIKYISPDRSIKGSLEYAEPTVGANLAWQAGWGGRGVGVGVAVVDSGIWANHPDLKSRVVYAESFVPNDPSTNDAYGHGTHVAGIVGGNATASNGPGSLFTFRGIAPKANLISLRVLDANGGGSDNSVIAVTDGVIQ